MPRAVSALSGPAVPVGGNSLLVTSHSCDEDEVSSGQLFQHGTPFYNICFDMKKPEETSAV